MGHALNNNTQLARTSAYYDEGSALWISVREGMASFRENPDFPTDVVHIGVGYRTPLMLIRYNAVTTLTGLQDDPDTPNGDRNLRTPTDESIRYIPVANDWEKIDCRDDFVPAAIQVASIKVAAQVGKIGKEQEENQLLNTYGQFFDQSESQLMQRELMRKDTQYKDRGHA
jgi:hypothetical protein